MSKTIEQKALEAYPNALIGNLDNLKKDGFIKGYYQAMQDFMEKACEWLIKHNRGQLVEQFKQYIQDESEN